MRHNNGFTLIELSIVLVIIGLIVGGVLVGQSLIEAASVRATIAQYETFRTAVNTFRTKYNDMPGDMTQANAQALGFAPTVRAGATYVTPGDGLIEEGSVTGAVYGPNHLAFENVLFWQDLSSAGLIPGSFTSATDAAAANLTAATIGNYLPAGKISGSYWAVGSYYGVNWYYLGGVVSTDGSGLATLSDPLTPTQAYNIDVKIDDGNPDTGAVYGNPLNDGAATYLVTGESLGGGGTGMNQLPAPAIECTIGSNEGSPTGKSIYDTIYNANNQTCALNLRF